ncbi:integrase [Oribacterium sinus]|uniref:Integrase n=1 Tax=Oribacterium sinus TaxID=237576 RepID=A0A7W9W2L4_9FIRM|nr:integrase [Oribacterium sinus]
MRLFAFCEQAHFVFSITVSAHIMRHTACTRMAEKRIDVKVLQYIMGHAHIDVTMDVYNHVSEMSRIESEITRLDSVAIS